MQLCSILHITTSERTERKAHRNVLKFAEFMKCNNIIHTPSFRLGIFGDIFMVNLYF